jgi:predicted nucleic-acid-binding Zn-ribbon protein
MWVCQKCNEQHLDSFEVCWSCGTSKDGTEDPGFQRADDVTAAASGDAATQRSKKPVGKVRPSQGSVCPKCRSRDVIPHVRIVDYAHGGTKYDLHVEVYESPGALLFKGAHSGTLQASICGRCGYTEMYVTNPQELLKVYQDRKA